MTEDKKTHPLDPIFKAYHDGELTLNSIKQHHADAFSAGEKGSLTDKDGKIHYDWLDKGDGKKTAREVQGDLRKNMTDFYATKITEKTGQKFDDDFAKERAVEAWYGFDADQIEQQIKQYGSQFDREFYSRNVSPRLEQAMRQKVGQNAARKLKEEHIGDVVKATGLEGRLSSDLTLEEAKGIMGLYASSDGNPSETDIRGQIGHKIKDTAYGAKKTSYEAKKD